MDFDTLLSYPWRIMRPEFTILGVATFMSLLDLFLKDKVDRKRMAWIGLSGITVALYFVLLNVFTPEAPVQQILYQTFRVDGFANGFKILFLLAAAIVFILAFDDMKDKGKEIPYRGEFYYLLLTAVLGAMVLASSADLITMFVGLELLSLSSYILVGMRKKRLDANESAFKYIVSGTIATAVMLYGMSFIYGLTGSSNLFEIASRLQFAYNEGYGLLIYLAFFLTFIGMAFKIAAVPFHMWAPDVYQGAPTPITAFLSVVSKAAGFAIILRLFLVSFLPVAEMNLFGMVEDFFFRVASVVIGIVAALSMVIGNVLALRQSNVKRLFAYSSIAQAGYILVPFAVLSQYLLDMIFYYLLAYVFMNLGAFAVIQSVTNQTGTEDIKGFAGLYHRSPLKALGMTIFLLSLAGLPITAGFFGKFFIIQGSLMEGNIWLAAAIILTSVVSYYYYFGLIRQMYMRHGESEAPLNISGGIATVIVICVLGTVLLGILPTYALDMINEHFPFFQIFEMVENNR